MNLAIEIGGTKLQIGTGEAGSDSLDKVYKFDVDKSKGAKGILDNIETVIKSLPESPQNIAVGFGGPINRKTGIVAASHQIDGWTGFDLKDWFLQKFDSAVYVENDANVAALGEAIHGAGKENDSIFYITLGSGVGGGMVTNKELYSGNVPGEAEIGLIKLSKGKDTLESLCSGWALNKVIRQAIKLNPASKLVNLIKTSTNHEAKYLKEAIELEDDLAIKIFNEYCDILAYGLSFVVYLFNPEVIVIGGGVSLIGDILVERLTQKLPKYISNTYLPGPEIKRSLLGEEVVLIGALSLIP